MSYKPWTPVIVGGTDVGDGMLDKPVVQTESSLMLCKLLQLNNHDKIDIIETSHKELADYSATIDSLSVGDRGYIDSDIITWEYGPRQKRNEERGQFVVEYHDGVEHQVYWVPC